MNGFILGEKSKQSQSFLTTGERVATTFIKTNPCYIVAINNPTVRGYGSIQLGFKKVKKIKKPVLGTITKAGIKSPLRFLREFRIDAKKDAIQFAQENGASHFSIGEKKFSVGQQITPKDFFKEGDTLIVSGTSKGKGFQGVVVRHGFKGGSKTHGQSDRQRAPGAIGMTTTPGRVFKGKRMAGRMGSDRITIKGLKVMEISDEGLKIQGIVPGVKGGLLEIKKQ